MARFAAIGDDGRNMVVWGIGDNAEEALEDARSQLREADAKSALRTAEITEERYQRIVGGEVIANDL